MEHHSEERIQYEIVEWFRNDHCRVGCNPQCIIFAVPNDTTDVRELMRKKSTGLMSGVSDLVVILKNRILFIEVKNEKGMQSDKQKSFQNKIEALGFEYYLVRSLEQFKKIIENEIHNNL